MTTTLVQVEGQPGLFKNMVTGQMYRLSHDPEQTAEQALEELKLVRGIFGSDHKAQAIYRKLLQVERKVDRLLQGVKVP